MLELVSLLELKMGRQVSDTSWRYTVKDAFNCLLAKIVITAGSVITLPQKNDFRPTRGEENVYTMLNFPIHVL